MRLEKQQQVEMPPEKPVTVSTKPEFRWPKGMAGTPEMPTQLHYAQEMPGQLHYVQEMPGSEAVGLLNASNTHISPTQAHQPPIYQANQPQQYHQWVPASPHAQEPHEMPGSSWPPVPVPRHELEGELNAVSPQV